MGTETVRPTTVAQPTTDPGTISGTVGITSDRLWVGPERQAWLDARMEEPDLRARAYRVSGSVTLEEMCWVRASPGSPTCTAGEIRDVGCHYVVLGVDGRWRWTLDLGIEPR